ncbi:MAG TPA: hypothetical protein VMD74_01340 [Candidatus Methylomirabilis sp.]|nr:hypothetical protein [Candidatus Methylomirabilis sp.]
MSIEEAGLELVGSEAMFARERANSSRAIGKALGRFAANPGQRSEAVFCRRTTAEVPSTPPKKKSSA